MKKLFDFRFNIYIVGLTISSIMERTITFFINDLNLLQLDPKSFNYHALSLFILILFFLITNVFLKAITQKKFVNRLAYGRKYIGGQWVEVVITKNGEISHMTKMHIDCEINEIKILGECYRSDSTEYKFNSICSIFDTDNLELHYLFIAKEAFKRDRTDFGRLLFCSTSEKNKLNKYTGHYYDGDDEYTLAAVLITDEPIIKKMDTHCIETICKDVFPKIKELHGRPNLRLPEYFCSFMKRNESDNAEFIWK